MQLVGEARRTLSQVLDKLAAADQGGHDATGRLPSRTGYINCARTAWKDSSRKPALMMVVAGSSAVNSAITSVNHCWSYPYCRPHTCVKSWSIPDISPHDAFRRPPYAGISARTNCGLLTHHPPKPVNTTKNPLPTIFGSWTSCHTHAVGAS